MTSESWKSNSPLNQSLHFILFHYILFRFDLLWFKEAKKCFLILSSIYSLLFEIRINERTMNGLFEGGWPTTFITRNICIQPLGPPMVVGVVIKLLEERRKTNCPKPPLTKIENCPCPTWYINHSHALYDLHNIYLSFSLIYYMIEL